MCFTLGHFSNDHEDTGLIMQVDLEKLFDSVGLKFFFYVLTKMVFGDYLINLMKIAFNGCVIYANMNCYPSGPICSLRGLH